MAAPTNASLPIISDDNEGTLLSALATLHGVVATYGVALPAFDKCEADEWERIASRTVRALRAKGKARQEAAVAHIRGQVAEIVTPYLDEARKARSIFLTLPAEVRKMMPQFPPSVNIPIDAFVGVFPTGTPVEKQMGALRTLNYTVGKGQQGAPFVKVDLDPKSDK
jgi:hypothetical protein